MEPWIPFTSLAYDDEHFLGLQYDVAGQRKIECTMATNHKNGPEKSPAHRFAANSSLFFNA